MDSCEKIAKVLRLHKLYDVKELNIGNASRLKNKFERTTVKNLKFFGRYTDCPRIIRHPQFYKKSKECCNLTKNYSRKLRHRTRQNWF